ncbi:hypothetical protein TI10_16440 [Photorhabdus luminescens subsp. luminescens]|uniref:Uncharacterized protein n=1 Tax=Photorhabdus luminescens TaxID=29488 RepID=A0A1G5R0Z9_PHOLU|nr:hypothetical protein [Photorhabdus luminescens]KMW72144.1 hypothetical protein TI10_16440 [Photorhabdus luminescens subsp. luminescens]SCZ67626.1 hypothetical protein SAMN02982990_02786 [Photorhabdus luminescens]
MFESFMNEVPKVHVNIKLGFHTGKAQKKVSVNENDGNSILAENSSAVYFIAENFQSAGYNKEKITLAFRDLKSNLLNNAIFCKERKTILKVPTLSNHLCKAKTNLLYTKSKVPPEISTTT